MITIREAYNDLCDSDMDRESLIHQIQEMTGVTRKAIVRKLNILQDKDSDVAEASYDPDDEETRDSLEIDEEDISPEDLEILALRKKIKSLEKNLSTNKLIRGEESRTVNDICEHAKSITPAPLLYKPSKPDNTAVTEVWHFTDWHIGEMIEKDEIEGFNDFSFDIAEKRIRTYVSKALDWTKLHRNSYSVNDLVVICTGDFISGDIHEELTRTNEFPVTLQCIKAGELLASAIATAAPYFKSVRVEFIVADNHSRLLRKPQFKEGGYNSYNYIVGKFAESVLKDHKNVKFNLYPVVQTIIDVQGIRYLCSHGNCVKGVNGIPYYGMQRKVGKEAFARMNMDKSLHFSKLILGHYHVPMKAIDYIMGGSLSGTTEFDHGCGRHCEPCQTAWFVHPSFGEFDFIEFWVGR